MSSRILHIEIVGDVDGMRRTLAKPAWQRAIWLAWRRLVRRISP